MLKRILWSLAIGILVLLALNTGLIKLGIGPAAGVDADREIFSKLGFALPLIAAFGVIQIAAGLGLLMRSLRRVAAMVLNLSFAVATLGLFVSDIQPFAFLSLSFILVGFVPMALPEAPGRALRATHRQRA